MRYSYGVNAQLEWLSMFACRGAGAKLSGMTSHQEGGIEHLTLRCSHLTPGSLSSSL